MIDDNKVILTTTASKLRASGYEVLTAEDGASAIRQVRQLEPHLILLDLNFPPDVGHGGGIPWDGLLLLSWLRRQNGAQQLPVIVITGADVAQYQDRCAEARVLDIFLKPIDHDALLASIRWALDEEVAQQELAPADSGAEAGAEAPAAVEPAKDAPRRKILFVDDTNDWRYLGTAYLGERGYEVVTAEDPVSALLQASQFKPDLIVLDLNLGGESAVARLKILAEVHANVPVLIYTGMELCNAEVSELLTLGASNCLRKGSLEELVTAVQEALSGHKVTAPPSAAPAAETQTAAQPLSSAAVSEQPPGETGAAAEGDSLPTLDSLRAGTTEELLNAVERARSETPEPTQAAPEPGSGVVPDELIESAAESILLVESDPVFADTLRSYLEPRSFRVSEVSSGAEAVSLLTAAEVDLIIFDLTLPDMRVHEFYRAVEAAKAHLCPRIIFMKSDDSHPSDDAFVRRLGGISLWKPFPVDLLLEAIQTIRGGIEQERLAAK